MVNYRILIVDDQIEVRRVLRAGIESLGPGYVPLDIPSAEEALLEISRQPVDLLVADIRLAGMSGLELMAKIVSRHPDVKVILFTGLSDPAIHQQAVESGAAAFFLKPIDMDAFLEAVLRCCPASPDVLKEPASGAMSAAPASSLEGHLARLRQDLGAKAVLLVNKQGNTLSQAGKLPRGIDSASLMTTIRSALAGSIEMARILGCDSPQDVSFFSGNDYDLALAHLTQDDTLLIVARHTQGFDLLNSIASQLPLAIRNLLSFLSPPGPSASAPALSAERNEASPEGEKPDPVLESILDPDRAKTIGSADADAFWDSLAEGEKTDSSLFKDALSYDQARQLGLTPKDGSQREE